ncbi:uncharacterized protein LOC126550459 [Aphis gossypii]|uniref:uncharacterized protein LOC126550459 n=1 Tax=Aphis gossypii TaxID=80765 RepID=UPI002158EC01|nr:uncharacterized protein LOC126550459 [Aphis gossypii]
MSDEDIIIMRAAFVFTSLVSRLKKNKSIQRRRWWQRTIFESRRRYNGNDLLNDLRLEHPGFKNFIRMSTTDFESLLEVIGPKIGKDTTHLRETIPINVRLAVTLRFLATGDSYTSLMYLFKISKQLISNIVPEICEAIVDALKLYVQMPNSSIEWELIANDFNELWNFPQCVGAIDGKHIVMQAPFNSGTEYFNYKGTFSVVLLAAVDAHYCFIYASVGCQGRISDGGVFNNSILAKKMYDESLNLPSPKELPGQQEKSPYVFVCDGAFPLKENLMKPFPGNHLQGSPRRAFNYRLSGHGVSLKMLLA